MNDGFFPDAAEGARAFAATLLQPVDVARPCGPDLEYDPAYALVMARLAHRADAQYGSFVDTPGGRDWAGIARDCELLLRRTRDIPLLIGWCRARLALAQAPGLSAALALLHAVLMRWPDEVHPQVRIDGHDEPIVRANAIAALADPDGLLGEIGNLDAIANSGMRLTVRDVARALGMPRPAEAVDPEIVGRHLGAMREGAQGDATARVEALDDAARHLRAIDAWSHAHLGDDAPSLERLMRLLAPFGAVPATLRSPSNEASGEEEMPVTSRATPPPPLPLPTGPKATTATAAMPVRPSDLPVLRARHDATDCIRNARAWFELHEPSSPVAVLLKQAERMVGQRFVQVADAIPLDLLRLWDVRSDAEPA